MEHTEILEELLGGISDEYDKSAGSFFYDILYPVAVKLKQRLDREDEIERNAYALTAVGGRLDNKVAEQGMTRRSGTYSSGTLRIYGFKGAVIHSGAKAASDDLLFAVSGNYTIGEAGYADVSAVCTTAGSVGNVRKGSINRFPVTLPDLTKVENITDFEGGYDGEDDESLRERYMLKVSHPTSNGDIYSYMEWAKEITGVGKVDVIPTWNGGGTVKVVITDANNSPANDELVRQVQVHLEEKRIIGAEITVAGAKALDISISAAITHSERTIDEIAQDVSAAVSEYAADAEYISIAKIGSLIMTTSGVEDYSDLKVNGGTVNIDIPQGSVAVLSEVDFYD